MRGLAALKDGSNGILEVSAGYARTFGVAGPCCMSDAFPVAFADAAYAVDQAALRWGSSRAIHTTEAAGAIEVHKTRVVGGVLLVVTDATADLRAALECRWPHFGPAQIDRLLAAVSGAGVDGVSVRPEVSRDSLLELASLEAIQLGRGEVYAPWLPGLLRQLRPLPGTGVEAALEMLAQSLGGSSMVTLGRVAMDKRYRVTVGPPRKGRDRGCWCLRIYGPGLIRSGRRELTEIPHSPRTRVQAESVARAREARLNGRGGSLLEVVESFTRDRREAGKHSPAYLETHDSCIAWLRSGSFAALLDGEVSASTVLDMRRDLGERCKVSTGRLYLGLVAQAWRWGRIRGVVSQPWPNVPQWRSPVGERPQKEAYSEQEVSSLLSHLVDYAGGHYLPLGWALVETAARIGEVLALRVGDVSVTGEVVLGRGGASKTGLERRALVSPGLVDALGLERDAGEWLFPSRRDSSKPVAYGTFRSIVVTWLRRAGLYGRRDIHSMRRRGAAELHGAKVPTEIGRRITGHEDSAVFLGYASTGRYDLTAASRILWVDVARLWPTSGDSPQLEGLEEGDSRVIGHTGKCGTSRNPRAPKPYGSESVPLVARALRESPPVLRLSRLLRLSCSGVQG